MPLKKKKPPVGFDENPEWTKGDFAKSTKVPGLKLGELAKAFKRGRPPLENPKEAIKLRLDSDVLESYRKTGSGWQTRINADLRKARKLKAG